MNQDKQGIHDFVTRYTVSGDRLQVLIDGKLVLKDLHAVVLSHEADSIQKRHGLKIDIIERIGFPLRNPNVILVELHGVVRAHFCDFEESFSMTDPLPAARAKVIVRLPCPTGDIAAFDRCVSLEGRLEAVLDGSDIGFVDGNDYGQGEFCIYCYGPRKSDLKERIRAFLEIENLAPSSLI